MTPDNIHTSHTSHKNFGLDLIRASAVAMVFIFHLSYLEKLVFSAPPKPAALAIFDGFFQFIGIGGVNLFFVLSGFLIGQLVLRDILPYVATPQLWSTLRRFYVRRWLRTIPAYYVVLSLAALWYWANGSLADVSYGLRNYFFLQEDALRSKPNAILGISWTLAAEEWFYFFLPLVFCVFCSRGLLSPLWRTLHLQQWSPHLRSSLGASAIVFIIGLPCLAVIWLIFHGESHHAKPFHWARFSGMPLGVILAIIKVYYAAIYRKMATPLSLFLAAVIIALIIGYIKPMSESFMDGFHQGRIFFSLG